jgi:galactokinase
MRESASIAERFRAKFGADPRVYRAPGRVNLIGEHTDYNEGFVMPAAVGFYCWVAISPREDHKLVICSDKFSGAAEVELNSTETRPRRMWSDYPVGVALQLKQAGFPLGGANILIYGEIPMGAGLSSSAAVEVATALALAEQSGHTSDRVQLASLCQKAENDFVGARVGIMDQFISLHGRKNHALVLDCRSLHYEFAAIPECVRLVVCNTMVKHELASGEYNRRRAECEEAIRQLAQVMPGISSLRDVTLEQLERHRGSLTEIAYKRALHVVAENARVLDAAEALRTNDLEQFGKYMAESHRSLRDLYEVSCAELDLMVDQASKQEGVYGARMTGGGFGGSTINLVKARFADQFAVNVARGYEKETGIVPQIQICTPAEGAAEVKQSELHEQARKEE